jgi:raffinose/stachyose/melibiose transport system permease protein
LSGSGLIPAPFSLQGYQDAFEQAHMDRYLLNSAVYAVGGTIGAVATGLLAAYPMARYYFPGRNAIVVAITLSLAIPAVAIATPEFFVMRELELFDSVGGLVIFYAALFFPVAFVMLRAFLLSIPPEVEEAAIIDGAGYFTIVRRVVVPLSRPALATVAVIVFVLIWNDFFFANLLVISEGHQNVQLALAAFRSQFGLNVSGMLAGTTLAMAVPIAAFLLLQRQVIAGLTAGVTK